MILSKDQFPVVVQAYDMTNNKEIFIAEQVVSNQSEVDTFVTRYTGKLIKARALTNAESNTTTSNTSARNTSTSSHTTHDRTNSSSPVGKIIMVILLILIILLAIGFYTGWIQRTFGIDL